MYNLHEYDVTARRGAIVATVIYVVVIVLALWLTRCDTAPPSEEELSQGSILISFGNSDEGSGEATVEEKQIVQESIPEEVVEPAIEPMPTDDTSEVEQLTPIEETPPDEEVVETPREVNRRALFPGMTQESSESKGDDSAAKGVVGTEAGKESNESMLGGGLSGDFNLAGRSLMGSLPVPQYDEQQEGRVVINIIVDESGRVSSASVRLNSSTTNNSTLINAAREAALKARFSPSEAVVQSGTITYIFRLN